MKKFFKLFLSCATAALCACGIAACADKPESVTVEQLIESNDLQKVVSEYGNLHVKQTTTDNTGALYTANSLFYANDYGLVMDFLSKKSDGSEFYSETLINGMRYDYEKGTNDYKYNAKLFDDGEYNAYVGLNSSIMQGETVVKEPEIKDGKIVLETKFDFAQPDSSEKTTFYFNAETLLIERVTEQAFLIVDGSSGTTNYEVSVELTYEYGCSDYTPALTAYNAHKNAEDKSSFIVVRNAGTTGEKRTEYTIAGESGLAVYNGEEKDYALYADADSMIEVENYKDYAVEGYVPVFYLAERNAVPTLKQIIEANDKQKVVEKYGNAHISETITSEDKESVSTMNMLFYANDYGLAADYINESTDGSVCYSVTVIDGMMYVNNQTTKGVDYKIRVIAGDYNAYVASKGNIEESEVIKAPEIKDGKIVVETAYEYTEPGFSYSYTKTYYCDIQTLLIESYVSHESIVSGTEEEKGYIHATVVYGSDYTPTMKAYNAHKNAEDKKEITIIRNGETDGEVRTQHTVSASATINVLSEGEKDYALFENETCTRPIDDVNEFIASNASPVLYLGEDQYYSEKYDAAVRDAVFAEESEIRDLVTLTADDERVSWKDGKVLLLTFHKYPSSYPEGETITTGSWYMWTVADGEITEWYFENGNGVTDFSVAFNQLLGMPLSSNNTYVSAVWVDVNDVIRPAYQPDPTKQLTAADLNGSSLGEYKDWFNANILRSYFSAWGQYPWTRLGYTYHWGAEDEYGLSEFLVLPGSTIEVEFTKTISEFVEWLGQCTADETPKAA